MKTCIKCGKTGEDNLFRKDRNTCKECTNQEQLNRVRETVEYLQSQKSSCTKCGYDKYKRALEFHHIDSETKEFNLARFAGKNRFTSEVKNKIDEELKKCVCLCANCHREYHYLEEIKEITSIEDFLK